MIPRSDKNRSPPETRILGTLAHAYCALDSAIVVALAVNVDFVTALPRSGTGAVAVAWLAAAEKGVAPLALGNGVILSVR